MPVGARSTEFMPIGARRRGGCLSGRMPVGALGRGRRTHLPAPPNTCMQPTGVSGAIFHSGASVNAFPLGNLALAPAANARR
jgi:hypothetical protein